MSAANQMLGNIQNTNQMNTNLHQQALNNVANAVNTGMNVSQQQFTNANNLANTASNLYGQQANAYNTALGNIGNIAQQQYSNVLGSNAQNAANYQAVLQGSSTPLTTAAATQEALLTSPTALWNASIGLNSQNTSGLGALAGTGSTTTNTSGGSVLTGWFG